MKCWKCQNELTTGDGDDGICTHCRSVANYTPTPPHVCTMGVDLALRWQVRFMSGRVLQQARHCVECGRIEWHDVPVTYEGDEPKP